MERGGDILPQLMKTITKVERRKLNEGAELVIEDFIKDGQPGRDATLILPMSLKGMAIKLGR
jgi:hypothetical protein